MADPLSVASTVIAFLQLAQVLWQWADDATHAKQERKDLWNEVEEYNDLLAMWKERLEEAKASPDKRWYRWMLERAEREKDVIEFTIKQAMELRAGTDRRQPFLSPRMLFSRSRSPSPSPSRKAGTSIGEKRSHERLLLDSDGPFARLAMFRLQLLERMAEPTNWKKYTYRLTWSASKSEAREKRDDIQSLSMLLNQKLSHSSFEVAIDSNTVIHQVKEGQENILQRKRKKDKDRMMAEILDWVSPFDFRAREREILHDKFHSGKWWINHPLFKGWKAGLPAEITCWGKPGAGKTVLSSIVLKHLRDEFEDDNAPPGQNPAVLSIFLRSGNDSKGEAQGVSSLYGSLVKQLIILQADSFDTTSIERLYKKLGKNSRPEARELEPILCAAISKSPRTYIVVDAVDEAGEQIETELIKLLHALPADKVSLMLTSRLKGEYFLYECDACHDLNIRVAWKYVLEDEKEYYICWKCYEEKKMPVGLEPSRTAELQIETPSEEIEDFVRWFMEKQLGYMLAQPGDPVIKQGGIGTTTLGRMLSGDTELQKKIPTMISERSGERFLLAKLYAEKLMIQPSKKAVREALSTLPEKLDEVYEDIIQHRIIENVNKNDSKLGMQVLTWLTYACRPMTLLELQQAIDIERGQKDVSEGYEIDEQKILEATSGLIVVDLDQTISFHHLTVREYLDRTGKRWFPDPQVEIVTALLTYLNYDEFAKPRAGDNAGDALDERLRKYPLYAYASKHWGDHVRDLDGTMSDRIRSDCITLLLDKDRVAATIQADYASWDVIGDVNGLNICGRFGLTALIPDLLQRGFGVDNSDIKFKQTALMYACRWGHVQTVTKLLHAKANINHTSTRGTTALFEAIEHENSGIVDILQEANVDVNKTYASKRKRAALAQAVSSNNPDSVWNLLKRSDVNVNHKDSTGETPLILAASRGYDIIVGYLLGHPDIEVDLSNDFGRTALLLAAENGHEQVVRVLLKKGANPAFECHIHNCNAATLAAQMCRLGVLQILLESLPSLIDSTDDTGRGLLHYAASEGAADIVEMLISMKVDVNTTSKDHGQTALHEVCRGGIEEVATVLLNNGAVPSIKDFHGRTPYLVAYQHNQKRLMEILLAHSAPIETLPLPGSLPTWSLVTYKNLSLLVQKIKQCPNDINCGDPDHGLTAVHMAAKTHQLDALTTLLNANAHASPCDSSGRTPLHHIALAEPTLADNILICNALLVRSCPIDALDMWRLTALDYAIAFDNWPVALHLIEHGARVNKDWSPIQGTLFKAVERGRPEAIRRLVEQGADVELVDYGRGKAVDVARVALRDQGEVREEVVKVLREAARKLLLEVEFEGEQLGKGKDSTKNSAEQEARNDPDQDMNRKTSAMAKDTAAVRNITMTHAGAEKSPAKPQAADKNPPNTPAALSNKAAQAPHITINPAPSTSGSPARTQPPAKEIPKTQITFNLTPPPSPHSEEHIPSALLLLA